MKDSRKLTIGVMGSAGGVTTPEQIEMAREIGREIARHDCILITGACPGLPHETNVGAKEAGGLTVGISPGLSLAEHVHKYQSPDDGYDVMIFTGSGLMGREITSIRSCDMVIIIGGRSGTLGEFSIAYDEGKLIGVLKGSGGIADVLPKIVRVINKETGATVVYDQDPKLLVDRLLEEYRKEHYKKPSVFHDIVPAGAG
jgi:uncharacterized protein (TIGR00725 family)